MERPIYQPVKLAHEIVGRHIRSGDVCIDATAGNGYDTLFLAEQTGPGGTVYAFDIQEKAIDNTKAKIKQAGYRHVQAVLDSHINMNKYTADGTIACIMFNLGWLPGGSHHIKTEPETTVEALKQALVLLKPGGIISMILYSGKDCGYEEKNCVIAYAETIAKGFTVLKTEFINRGNDPPLNLFIVRDFTG